MTMALLLKLNDQLSGPLKDATKNLDVLSDTAKRIGNIKAFESLQAELDALSKALVEAKRKRDFFINSAETGGAAGAKAFEADIRDAKEEVLRLAATMESKRKDVASMGESLRTAGVNTNDLKASLAALDAQLAKETRVKRLSEDIDRLAESAKRVGDRLESFGRNAMAYGVVLVAGVQQTIAAYAKLETASADLKATLMTDKGVSKNFEALNGLAIELGNRLPGTTADFSNMMAKLLQLGVTEEAILGGVGKAAANLAVVMKLPYEQAAEIAAKLKEATGTSEADMLKFMDTIQRVGHQGVQTGEMMYAFARSAGVLKQFNIQGVEQAGKISAVYAQLLKTGASGETVGTGMSMVLQRLLDFDNQSTTGAKSASESLKELGIQIDFFDDKTGQFKGVDNMIAQLDKLKGLNQSKMGDVLKDMFGGGQDAQFVALLAQSGVAGNKAMQQSMASQADIDTRVGVKLDTLAAKWEAASGTFENLLAKIGETMAPKLGQIVDWFNQISEAAQHLVGENKELFGWLGLTAAGAAGALVVGSGMAMAIGGTLKMIADLMVAIKALSVFLMANPVVLAILGVAAAGAAGYAFGNYIGLDEVGKKLGFALYDVVQSLKKGYGEVKQTLAAWRQIGVDIVMGLWEGIKATIRKPLDAIGELATSLPAWAKKLLDIHSPSRVFEEIGENVALGMAQGIAGQSGVAVDAAIKMVNEVVSVDPSSQPRTANGKFQSRADYSRQGTGFEGGLNEYLDSTRSVMDQMKTITANAFKGMEDALVQFVMKGKLDFGSMADSIISDLIRIQIQQSITQPLANMMGSVNWASMFTASANGNVFQSAGLHAYANQIVNRPTMFAFAKGAGLMGEAGPEAIMPLKRDASGRLGVSGGGGNMTVNIVEAPGRGGQRSQRSDGNGGQVMEIFVEQIKAAIAGDIARGSGDIPAALSGTYGLNRAPGGY